MAGMRAVKANGESVYEHYLASKSRLLLSLISHSIDGWGLARCMIKLKQNKSPIYEVCNEDSVLTNIN